MRIDEPMGSRARFRRMGLSYDRRLFLPSLREKDERLVVSFDDQCHDWLDVVDTALEDILRAFDMLEQHGYSVPTFSVRDAQLRLVARSFNSIQAALLVMRRGYFQQALTLVRMVSEDQLVAEDVAIHPPTLEALFHDTAKLGQGDLSYSAMAERISKKAKAAWRQNYGDLSRYGAHPRMGSLMGVLTQTDGRTTLGLGGRYQEIATAWFFLELFAQLKYMFVRVGESTGEASVNWVDGAVPTFELVEKEWNQLEDWAHEQLREGLE